jgi:hypothetical protein
MKRNDLPYGYKKADKTRVRTAIVVGVSLDNKQESIIKHFLEQQLTIDKVEFFERKRKVCPV